MLLHLKGCNSAFQFFGLTSKIKNREGQRWRGKVCLFIEIHKKLKEIKKNILATENFTCI